MVLKQLCRLEACGKIQNFEKVQDKGKQQQNIFDFTLKNLYTVLRDLI